MNVEDRVRILENEMLLIRDGSMISLKKIKDPYVDVRAFGARGDGIANDTVAIQLAVNYLNNLGGGILYLPRGIYIISAPIITYSKIHWIGSGRFVTEIRSLNYGVGATFPGFMIKGVDVNNVSFRDFSMRGPSVDGNEGSGISFSRANNDCVDNAVFVNLFLYDFAGIGIYISAPILTTFQNVRVQKCAEYGFLVYGGTSTNFYECYSLTNAQAGFHLEVMTYCSLVGCATEGCGIGYNLLTSRNISLLACGAEETQYRSVSYPGRAYSLVEGKDNTLISCYSSQFAVATGTEKTHLYVSAEINDTVLGFRGNSTVNAPNNTYKFVDGAKVSLLRSEFTGLTGDGGVGTPDFDAERVPIVSTGSLPAAGSLQNGKVIIEDAGSGDRNLIIYGGGERFRIDGGAGF